MSVRDILGGIPHHADAARRTEFAAHCWPNIGATCWRFDRRRALKFVNSEAVCGELRRECGKLLVDLRLCGSLLAARRRFVGRYGGSLSFLDNNLKVKQFVSERVSAQHLGKYQECA